MWINITDIVAQDDEGNWHTLTVDDNKQVEDCELPEIDNLVVDQNTSCYADAWVNITVDVTDNCGVSGVQVNITGGPGAPATWPMTQIGATSTYYVNTTGFTSADVGTWIFHIYATDVNGNGNESAQDSFVLWDNYGPEIGTPDYPDPLELCNDWCVEVEVTDDYEGVDQVNITFSAGYTGSYEMTLVSGNTYQWCFHPTATGTYSFIIEAWDGNSTRNYNSSVLYSFEVEDTTDPVITNIVEYVDPLEFCNDITINATVTDCNDLEYVNITIDAITLPMVNTGGDYWEATWHPPARGSYGYYIMATDIAGNVAITPIYAFLVQDTTAPVIDPVVEYDDPLEFCNDITINATVTDHQGIDYVEITGDWGTELMTHTGGNYYEFTWHPPAPGTYTWLIEAYDLSQNMNSVSGDFVVEDTTDPTIDDVTVTPAYDDVSSAKRS
ncbi:MAG: Ig-like domain-containing protein, partial [Thermoplasmatota archaeon]